MVLGLAGGPFSRKEAIMAIKDVTHGQLEEVKRLARDAGVGRELFQTELLDNGALAALLRKVGDKKSGSTVEIVPPEGGRVHVVRVPVRLDREWQEAINAVGPHTPDSYNVRKVGDQYPPSGAGTVKAEIILMNFGPNGGNWDLAIAWAKQYRLKRTNPRHVFAIGEHKPQLHHELGMDPMYVVATEECTFEGGRSACDVWWGRSGRGADLYWLEYYGFSSDWFAFLRE